MDDRALQMASSARTVGVLAIETTRNLTAALLGACSTITALVKEEERLQNEGVARVQVHAEIEALASIHIARSKQMRARQTMLAFARRNEIEGYGEYCDCITEDGATARAPVLTMVRTG